MQAIENLMAEHQIILGVIDALEGYGARLRRGEDVDRQDLADFAGFIRNFADTMHHGKEEDILFAAMVEAGFSRQAGPIAVMLHEHDIGRGLTRAMVEAAGQTGPWTPSDREAVVRAALGYAHLLRDHIRKEDMILYPMAESRLPEAVAQRVEQSCRRYDEQVSARGDAAKWHEVAKRLTARYASETPSSFEGEGI